jgi:hypothetical protein
VEEILGLIVDAMRKRGATARGTLAAPPQVAPGGVRTPLAPAPQVGNTAAEIAAAIERANAADAPPPAAVAPAAPRSAPPRPQAPAAPRPAPLPGPPELPRLLAGFGGDATAFLQAFVVSEALAPPITLRPPSH